MLYHNNGKLQVFANTRCASTNMHHYFGISVVKQRDFPAEFSNNLVIVLRNPLDRLVSASTGIPSISNMFSSFKKDLSDTNGKEASDAVVEEYAVFLLHCFPYLRMIKDKQFRIIDFDRVEEYIPRRSEIGFFQSPTTYSSGYTDPKTVYVENKYFTLTDLEIEYETYLELLKDREQISVDEWKEKTT